MIVVVLKALGAYAESRSRIVLSRWLSIMQHGPIPEARINARGIPTAECPMCASRLFTIQAAFDDNYQIAQYLLNAECAMCGTLVTAPTPLDLKNV